MAWFHTRSRGVPPPRSGVYICPVPARPCSCPGLYVPLANEAEVFGSCCSVPSWGVDCGVHPPSPGRVCVGTLFPACLVLSPCVVAPPPNCVRFCPGALACGCSCFAYVRPCAQGRCGRCPPGSGVMSGSDLFFFLFFFWQSMPHSLLSRTLGGMPTSQPMLLQAYS